MKLVEEGGEVAEVLNGRSGRKEGVQDSNEKLSKERSRYSSPCSCTRGYQAY